MDLSSPPSSEVIKAWDEEQYAIASNVIEILDDGGSAYRFYEDERWDMYNILSSDKLYGGLDISYDGNKSVAVFVIMRGRELIYCNHEIFESTIPYISSYLAFREADPYVSKAVCSVFFYITLPNPILS